MLLIYIMGKYYTEGQKQSILKWRSINKSQYNDYMNDYHKQYYQDNVELFRKKRMMKYYLDKEWKRLCNISI
jgi:hypothetical protein